MSRTAALAGLLLVLHTAAGASAAAAPALEGTWDVVRVAVDPADQPRWTWRPEDPRLLGRELRIDSGALRFDGDESVCDQPQWTSQRQPLTALLRASFPRPLAPGRAVAPAAAEMGLAPAPADLLVQRPRCRPDAGGRVTAPWDAAWLARPARDRLLLRHGQALLQLVRRAAAAVPTPSFKCSAAATAAEKALCADVALAAWDRSVAQAFREAQARRRDEAARLQAEQRTWLQERDRCGAEAGCLRERMRERVAALVQE